VRVSLVLQAVGLFAVTDVDDIVILAVFFGQARRHAGRYRVVAGQYLGFAGILGVSVLTAVGAGLLPESVIPYLGLVPLALGLRAGWSLWRERRNAQVSSGGTTDHRLRAAAHPEPGAFSVAAVTFANGGDNLGVYVPVFANADGEGLLTYTIVFIVLVGIWCAAGWYVATRPLVAQMLSRWAHLLLPTVLVSIGLVILIEGDAFGL
jgi:cadmium resistance protein CadD (predicted permease)